MPSLVQLRWLTVCVGGGGVQTEVIVYLELCLQGLCMTHTYLALFLRPEALSSSWAVVSMCMAFAPAWSCGFGERGQERMVVYRTVVYVETQCSSFLPWETPSGKFTEAGVGDSPRVSTG